MKPKPDLIARIAAARADIDQIDRLWSTYLRQMGDHSPGIRSGLGGEAGPRAGGVSDPTGQAVANAAPDDRHGTWRTDPIIAAHRRTLEMLTRAMQDLGQTRRAVEQVTHPTAEDRRVKHCRNTSCNTVIETKGSDLSLVEWCAPCYSYRTRHGMDAPPRVVADRERKRAERGKVDA